MRSSISPATVVCVAIVVLTGCQSQKQPAAPAIAAVDCPDAISRLISVSGSSAPRVLPQEISFADAQVIPQGMLARRILIGIGVKPGAASLVVVGSSLSLRPVGGVFTGWAQLADSSRAVALQVEPGEIRLAPVSTGAGLRSGSLAVDASMIPGGQPIDEQVTILGNLWDQTGSPIAPEQVQISFSPVRHATVFDTVDGLLTVKYDFIDNRAHQSFSCSAENKFQLVDRNAMRLSLWDIARPEVESAKRERWLALYDSSTGPVRLIFPSAAAANELVAWLRATRSLMIGRFKLGLYERPDAQERSNRKHIAEAIMRSLHDLTSQDVDLLRVDSLDER